MTAPASPKLVTITANMRIIVPSPCEFSAYLASHIVMISYLFDTPHRYSPATVNDQEIPQA